MSFIQQTMQCDNCKKLFNVALGTFGYGMPKECPYCKQYHGFSLYSAGWYADNEGNLKPSN